MATGTPFQKKWRFLECFNSCELFVALPLLRTVNSDLYDSSKKVDKLSQILWNSWNLAWLRLNVFSYFPV